MSKPRQTQADIWYALLYPGGQPGWWIGRKDAKLAKVRVRK